jgi:hypothetical protein
VLAFIFGDFFPQAFCGSLHLLGLHRHARQFGQQFAAFRKLTIAPPVPVMRVSAGERAVFSIPRS